MVTYCFHCIHVSCMLKILTILGHNSYLQLWFLKTLCSLIGSFLPNCVEILTCIFWVSLAVAYSAVSFSGFHAMGQCLCFSCSLEELGHSRVFTLKRHKFQPKWCSEQWKTSYICYLLPEGLWARGVFRHPKRRKTGVSF